MIKKLSHLLDQHLPIQVKIYVFLVLQIKQILKIEVDHKQQI